MSANDENLKFYCEYNKTLRAWLVGFGFGVPALFIVNEKAGDKLAASSNAEWIIWLFLIGAAAQVLIAFINKIVSWCAYHQNRKGAGNVGGVVSWCAKIDDWFLIDVTLDVLSLFAFSTSILMMVNLFTN